MFQGMFRKRGRPPDPPLQIGGYDKPIHEESKQIPAHQVRDAPRQLPLPAVREFEQNAIMQQEQPGFNNAIVESSSSQQVQQDVDMLDSHNRRLMIDPRHHSIVHPCRNCKKANYLLRTRIPRVRTSNCRLRSISRNVFFSTSFLHGKLLWTHAIHLEPKKTFLSGVRIIKVRVMARKHSPSEIRPEGPFGSFEVSTQIWAFLKKFAF